MSSSQPTPLAATAQRACDQCNARKIRCDKLQPCSHCKAAGLACRMTLQRPKQQRDRVMVSKQYENKIDRIDARLAAIERLLQERLPAVLPLNATPAQHGATSESTVEANGYTGPHADSLAAKEAFEQVAGASPLVASDESLKAALSSFRGIIDRVKADSPDNAPSGTQPEELPIPSWDHTQQLLQRIESSTPTVVKIFLPCLDLTALRQKCSRLYHSNQEGTIYERLLVYSGLAVICSELSSVSHGAESEHNHFLARSFSQQVLRTIDVMPAIMRASWDGVEALTTATITCLEMCKPQLAMTLISLAAKCCSTLGYNRLSATDLSSDAERQRKVLMFWQVYIYDRNTALRLGKPPSIPAFDVTTECLEDPVRLPDYPPGVTYLHRYWAAVADIQGVIGSELYSPVGLRQSLEQRTRLVETLSTRIKSAWQRRIQVNGEIEMLHADLGTDSFTAQCIRVGDEIAYYGTLTLVLHALSPAGRPTTDAIEAARACLRAYSYIRGADYDNVYTWSGFCHCVTLYSPLTPFTVLFTHVINDHENGNVDLELLRDFVEGLKPARQVSDGIDRFFALCSRFYQIAEAYISAKSQETVVTKFDNYLSTLGLLPQTASVVDPTTDSEGDLFAQDWYSGNVSLYGLIEDGTDMGDFGADAGLQWPVV